MKRAHVIVVASALALLGGVLPIAVALHMSSSHAVRAEQVKLEHFARQAITRADAIFERAETVLKTLAETPISPCSSEHILLMRRMTVNASPIDEIGFFAEGYLKCTA